VVEYNCRFGDPETQPILMRLKSDLIPLCNAAIDGKLDTVEAEWDPRTAVGIVLAAGGYPDAYRKGDIIHGLDSNQDSECKVFHAGTAAQGDDVVTSGGRVLCATALGDSVSDAQAKAYNMINDISWPDMYYRTDIAYRAIARQP
jgi:phosphoribosylamine--glycine ligase